LYDDECFFGMMATLTSRQRLWTCRMMSEHGCSFVRGECETMFD
jgi:hypothetical protein